MSIHNGRNEVLEDEIFVVNDEKMSITLIEKVANDLGRLKLNGIYEIVQSLETKSNDALAKLVSILTGGGVLAIDGQVDEIAKVRAHRHGVRFDFQLQRTAVGRLKVDEIRQHFHSFDHVFDYFQRRKLYTKRSSTHVWLLKLLDGNFGRRNDLDGDVVRDCARVLF